MLSKRIIGTVVVKDGWAVQSIGYGRYLPLGKPECLVENLDRWGADEIIVLAIDRSRRGSGPDLELLGRLGRLDIATPLVYGGGIRHADDAVAAIHHGADRISIDTVLFERPGEVAGMTARLGAQALVAALPAEPKPGGLGLDSYAYSRREVRPFPTEVLRILSDRLVSEAMVIDWQNEGLPGGYRSALVDQFPVESVPLIAFGGISEPGQVQALLSNRRVAGVAVGNFLSYREHAVQRLKLAVADMPIRPAAFMGGVGTFS